ncbi:MAG: T9SS type A sorting domain-containing protein [Bacteroidales bacterium]|nr:T9SS type A sorting domain-containing protein [Bacteroidales bacterium]
MKKATIILYLFLFQLFNLNAQGINWASCYGGSNCEFAESIQQTIGGGYIVAGFSDSNDGDVSDNHGYKDYWIVKLDDFGNIEWQKCLGGSNEDYPRSIQQTTDGGYIVAGWTASNDGNVSGNHGTVDYWIIKLNELGNLEWQKCLGGSDFDVAYSIQQTTDGGYIVAGWAASNDGDVSGNHGEYDYWVVKLDSSGNIEWQKCLGGSNNDLVYSIQQTTDVGYIVAGGTVSNDGDVSENHGNYDYWVVKLDNIGNIEWQKCLGGTGDDKAYSIQQTTDGGYIVAGYSDSNDGDVSGNHGGSDSWVVKLDDSGTIEWQKCLGGWESDGAKSTQQTTDGGYIVVGYTFSNDGNVSGNHGGGDYWIVKLNELGNLEWQKCLGGSDSDCAYSIQQTTDEGYIVAGYTYSNDGDVSGNHGYEDYWVIKLCISNSLSIEIQNPNYCYTTNLIAIGDFEEYLWSTGETTQSITITTGGLYSVIAYSESGCPSEAEIYAPYPLEPYNQSKICMVTLDEEIEKNLIVYEPIVNVGIDSILFYRLNNQTSEYDGIGANSINDIGLFIDQGSVPAQQNYQYKIAIIDTCGKTSGLSPKHQTILLQANTGINNEINLFWNAYYGFAYPNFGVYRSVDGGEYILIANVPNNTYTYIDYPPSGEKKYQVRVEKDPPCNPEKSTYSFVSSNSIVLQPGAINENEFGNFNIYPNPFDNDLIIERNQGLDEIKIELIDIYGRFMDTYLINSGETKTTISTDHLLPGVYYLRFNNIITKHIVKQ